MGRERTLAWSAGVLACLLVVPAYASATSGAVLSIVALGAQPVPASPGRTIDLSAVLSNDGTESTFVSFATTSSAGWSTSSPARVELDAGQTMTLDVRVIVTSAQSAQVRLTATSADGSTHATALWSVDAHLVLAAHPSKPAFFPAENVTGIVSASYPDGVPAGGVAIRVSQSWTPFPNLGSVTTGPTDARGIFAFSFGQLDAASRLPGNHDLAILSGAQTTTSRYLESVAQVTSAP